MSDDSALRAVFDKFCAFGAGKEIVTDMDNAKFTKLCRDAKLFDKKFATADADLVFQKAKRTKSDRRIDFGLFQERAVPLIAERKGCGVSDVVAALCAAAGPQSSGTKPGTVKLHDDKENYTGIYARGGPSTVDVKVERFSQPYLRKDERRDLAEMVSDHDALTCDIRGVVPRKSSITK